MISDRQPSLTQCQPLLPAWITRNSPSMPDCKPDKTQGNRASSAAQLCFQALPAELNWIPSAGSHFQSLSKRCREQVLKGLAVFMLLLVFNKSCF